MIGIIDYGLGNIRAFVNIYERLNIATAIIRRPKEMEGVSRIILPGVGAFDWAMSRLNDSGLRAGLDRAVLERGVPVIGICVGMQMMANRSEEGSLPGLGWLDADVVKFPIDKGDATSRLPHMGWNDVTVENDSPLFGDRAARRRFYFLHSYYVEAHDAGCILTRTVYGKEFTSAVMNNNVFGVQFHPEKSHEWGVSLLRNFALNS